MDKLKEKIQNLPVDKRTILITAPGKNPVHRIKAKKFRRDTMPEISHDQLDALRRQVMARQAERDMKNPLRNKCVSDAGPSRPDVIRINFWASTNQTIREPIDSSLAFENTLKEIENTIQSANKPNENLFYTLLSKLVWFHTCDKNKTWHENTFSSDKTEQLNQEYRKISALSNPEQNLTASKPTFPASAFFQLPKQIESPSIKSLITTLQNHLKCLIQCRKISTPVEVICDKFLKFIRTNTNGSLEITTPSNKQLLKP